MVALARFGHCPPQEPTILLIAAVHAPCLLWVKTRITALGAHVSFRQLRTCRRVCSTRRLRALALFSRRSSERAVRSSLPAAENLHKSCLMQCSKKSILLDHLVGERKQLVWNLEAERLRGL